MKILDIYEIKELDYKSKSDSFISGFSNFGRQIFKPLNKTKTCLTPLFAFSEVFWSYYIQKYFVSDTPRYFLAKCKGLEDKAIYYEEGTLVFNVLKDNQKLVDLKEYFRENKDPNVDIDNYENYHNILYSYTDILNSKIFREREDLRHQLEMQILLSILTRDENFHYGNVSFIIENGEVKSLCPPLDFEFSLMFMYPDKRNRKDNTIHWRNEALFVPFDKIKCNTIGGIWEEESSIFDISLNNILKIVSLDSEFVREFIDKLDLFISDIESTDILFYNKCFFDALSSDAWEIYDARYVKKDEMFASKKEIETRYSTLDQKQFNENLKQECLDSAKELKFNLQVLLILKDNDCLNNATVKRCFELKDINITKKEYSKLSVNDRLALLDNQKMKKIND